MAERGIGDNRPRVELTDEEAEFVHSILDRDIAQGLQILTMVQAGELSESAARKTVEFMDKARPIAAKLRSHCNG